MTGTAGITTTSEGESTVVLRLEIDATGQLVGEFSRTFWKVEMEELEVAVRTGRWKEQHLAKLDQRALWLVIQITALLILMSFAALYTVAQIRLGVPAGLTFAGVVMLWTLLLFRILKL